MVYFYVIEVRTELDFGLQQGLQRESESGKKSERDKEREAEKDLLAEIWFIFMLLKSRLSSTLGGSKGKFRPKRGGVNCKGRD